MTMTENELQDGRVVAIAGPVIDVEFPRGALPELNSAIEFTVTLEGETTTVLAEVAQQLGDGRVRAICMKPTDGLVRGAAVRNTGHGIQVPVGEKVLGNVWNVWGEALDTQPEGIDEMDTLASVVQAGRRELACDAAVEAGAVTRLERGLVADDDHALARGGRRDG